MTTHKIYLAISVVLLITWMVVVFSLSGQVAADSSNTSAGVIRWISTIFNGSLTESALGEIISKWEPLVRKLAHFILYTIGGCATYNLVYAVDSKLNCKRILSWLIGTAYAVSDEIHQLFVPGRSGELMDTLIDSSGVLLGTIVLAFAIKFFVDKKCAKK